jgi:transposase
MIVESNLTKLLDLNQSSVLGLTQIEDSICFHIELNNSGAKCPHCDLMMTELHQTKLTLIRDLPVFGKPVYLRVPRRQFYCRKCQRYSKEKLDWLDWQRRHTQRYEANIFERIKGASIEKVAQEEGLSFDEVEGMFKHVSKSEVKKNGSR